MEIQRKLENEALLVEVSDFGGELVRIYDKEQKREVLWDGKKEIWPRHAPILFPFVGSCYEGSYQYRGKKYEIMGHGFARDKSFALLSYKKDEVWHVLKSTEETEKMYPFPFRLKTGYKIQGREILVSWIVENTGDDRMYFSIGGHPAFRMPDGVQQKDCGLLFASMGDKKELIYHLINPESRGLDIERQYRILLEEQYFAIDEHSFDRDALVFQDAQINEVTLTLPQKKPYVTLKCEGFPYMGIWSKPGASFICLEPWFGRCDNHEFKGELTQKPGVQALEPGEIFDRQYQIVIHK